MRLKYVPDDEIPSGDETNRLHRWGYKRYLEMFNDRQLLGLELSARFISKISNERVSNVLAKRGKVFTAKTLDRLVECTRLREFKISP